MYQILSLSSKLVSIHVVLKSFLDLVNFRNKVCRSVNTVIKKFSSFILR